MGDQLTQVQVEKLLFKQCATVRACGKAVFLSAFDL